MLCRAQVNRPIVGLNKDTRVAFQCRFNPHIQLKQQRKNCRTNVGSIEPSVAVKELEKIPRERFTVAEVSQHNTSQDCWIIVNDKVYDVTEFVEEHPGGKIVQEYAGRDASQVFSTFHSKQAWQQLSEFYIGELQTATSLTAMQEDYEKLFRRLKREGMFKSNMVFYLLKVASNQSILGAAVLTLFYGPALIGDWPTTLIASVITALYWQQTGWLTHDFTHHQVFSEQRYANNWMGYMMGNIFQGISVGWWKNKHNMHHALPNYVHHQDTTTAIDPDIKTTPLVAWSKIQLSPDDPIENLLIKLQYFTFIPILSVARIAWCVESFLFSVDLATQKKEYAEIICSCVHYLIFLSLAFGTLPVPQALAYCVGANLLSGLLLGAVFIVSHNGMEILSDRDEDFASAQILSTRNIQSSVFMDWFTGGLNFQIEHHLFPTMPRHNLSLIVDDVKALCERNGLDYENKTFAGGFERVMETLDEVAQHTK